VLAEGLDAPVGLVLEGDGVLVLERGQGTDAGRIHRVARASGTATVLRAGLDAPSAVAADATTLLVTEGWRVAAFTRASGAGITLTSGIQTPLPRFVVVGKDVLIADGSRVKRVPTAGGTVEKVRSIDCGAGATSSRVEDLATDGASLYLAFRTAGPEPGWACRLPLDGGPATRYAPAGISNPQECIARVAVDAANVYWTSGSTTLPLGCAVHKAPNAGGAVTTLFNAPLRDIALDGTDLYFTAGAARVVDGTGAHFVAMESVNRISTGGGATTTWAKPGFPTLLAVGSRRLVWIGAEGTIAWSAKGGQEYGAFGAIAFEENAMYVDALLIEGSTVFWTNTLFGTIHRLELP
jgi:hypothetical protein